MPKIYGQTWANQYARASISEAFFMPWKQRKTLALGKLWAKLHGNICYRLLFVGTRWKFAHGLPMIWMLVIFCKKRIPIIGTITFPYLKNRCAIAFGETYKRLCLYTDLRFEASKFTSSPATVDSSCSCLNIAMKERKSDASRD